MIQGPGRQQESRTGKALKIAVGHRDKYQVGNAVASTVTRDRGGYYAPHDNEVDSSLNRTTETLLNDETHCFEQLRQQTNSSVDTIPLWNMTLMPLRDIAYRFHRIHYEKVRYSGRG
jgi:hypothetical protein